MSDYNGLFALLAAALAPHLAQIMAQSNGGNPVNQAGGAVGGFVSNTPQNTAGIVNAGGVPQGTVQGNMFGGTPQQAAAPQVTPDMIQQLITPLVQNEQVKQALTAQMQQMGIQNLPDARPDQLPELYSRFQQVDQQARAAGLIGGGAQGGTPSII